MSLDHSMTVKLLSEQHLEFLSLKEAAQAPLSLSLVIILLCWKSYVTAHMQLPSGARDLKFGPNLIKMLIYVCMSRVGSGKSIGILMYWPVYL